MFKYKVLKEVIRRAYDGNLDNAYLDIPKVVSPGPKSELRCCIYKERAIVQENVKMAMGGDKSNPNVVEVIDIACDECPIGGIYVSPACRGCISHACAENCPRGAISIVDRHATVDKEKCIECGKCAKACPYGAIIAQHRPCIVSCKVKAISMNSEKKAKIDNDKCISCGACITQCPFGALVDKSYVVDIVNLIKGSENNTKYKVYAVVAPSIVSQCRYSSVEQLVTAIKMLGFHSVFEAALGADITLYHEAMEWKEKGGAMTTSCCPAFVTYVEKYFPEIRPMISHSPSPMVETSLLLRKMDPNCKIVFIGPCVAKKGEIKHPRTESSVDSVMSFEELQAFVDARRIDTTTLEGTPLENASFFGRIFARSGGISAGLQDLAQKNGIEGIKPVAMNGIEECRNNLMLLKLGKSPYNFFEGMACVGGCVNGPLCINHGVKNIGDVDQYGRQAAKGDLMESVNLWSEHFDRDDNGLKDTH
ncbi:MAG: monomeric [FeFe] hydrogenase [Bacteroidales bacterium]|nr:monomeric [FeFe] hydrogenase [Candidatus Cacconaster merdequi]